MSVPTPPKALDGHCATVDNGKLYVLSSDSFQSIALKEGATWNTETAASKPVKGAACAKVTPNGDESQATLYVIGGTSNDTSFGGLQRYNFSNKTWETLDTPVDVLKGRLNHSATYIPDSGRILVYAGSQADTPSYLSSQTFTVLTTPPYTIDSFTSYAHTANSPILEAWNSSHAVMAGGTSLDSSVYLFEPSSGWTPLGTNLSTPLAPGIKGTIVNGTDGSKVLQAYDMSIAPNNVTQTVLLGAGGTTVPNGQTPGDASSSSSTSQKLRRDLTLQSWPTYNSSLAPSTTRSDYALAQDDQGLVVFAGGNSKSAISIFNQTGNSWVDANKYFNSQQPITPSSSSSSSSSATTPTSTSSETSSTSTSDAGSGAIPSQDYLMKRDLGIIIGICGGLLLIAGIIFLLMRWRKKKRGDGGRMSFADRGASFMKEAEGSSHNNYSLPAPGGLRSSTYAGPKPVSSNKYGKQRAMPSHHQQSSYGSTAGLVHHAGQGGLTVAPVEMMDYESMNKGALVRKPVEQQRQHLTVTDEERERRKRSSGWSRYFATSHPKEGNMEHLPSAYRKPVPSDGSSYSDVAPPQLARIPSSTLAPLVAPLGLDFTKTVDGQRLSTVASASPSFVHSQEDLAHRGSTAESKHGVLEHDDFRPISNTNTVSSIDRATLASTTTSEYHRNSGAPPIWTPNTTSFKDHLNSTGPISRPTSSLYASSAYDSRAPSSRAARGHNPGFFPGSGAPRRPSRSKATSTTPSAEWSSLNEDDFRAPPGIRDTTISSAYSRDSSVTVFPEPNGDSYTAAGAKDLSRDYPPPPRLPDLAALADEKADKSSRAHTATERDQPNLTLFPRTPPPGAHYTTSSSKPKVVDVSGAKQKPAGTDMSWLNLGLTGGGR